MATGSETLDPGDAATYTATWADPPAGDYRVRAWVVADDADASATADLTVE